MPNEHRPRLPQRQQGGSKIFVSDRRRIGRGGGNILPLSHAGVDGGDRSGPCRMNTGPGCRSGNKEGRKYSSQIGDGSAEVVETYCHLATPVSMVATEVAHAE